jgi:hypothetical protein
MDTYDELRDQEAEAEFWENLPKQLHEESVRSYLGVYGDALDKRINFLLETAHQLYESSFWGPSLTVSATAIEVMIGYFCIRPIVEGAFLSDLWAGFLAKWVIETRASDQRQILVGILRLWDIAIDSISLADRRPFWGTIQSEVLAKRNRFVHRGDEVSKEEAALGLDCAQLFRREVISRIGDRLGFTLAKTGRWAEIAAESGRRIVKFSPLDPFQNRPGGAK